MKKLIRFICTLGLISILLGLIIYNKDSFKELKEKIDIITGKAEVSLEEKNKYYREYDFDFVQNTNNFSPNCYEDILNIYYTVINSGVNSFKFYCPKDYKTCIDDVKSLANNQNTLSDINNFVHPYNSFQHIETEYDNYGTVTIKIEKSYNDEDVKAINEKIDKIMAEVVKEENSTEQNIRLIHDYIINNSKYDSKRSDEDSFNYKSDIAYGPLLQGYGICGGYTDAMELFLEKLNVKSFKISSNNHIWNAVYLDNKWSHLDLTWDDPIVSDGSEMIDHSFYFIDTKTLLEKENVEHNFNQNIYTELKQN